MIRLGSIFGTTIAIDFSFLILIALFVANGYDRNRGIEHALLWIPVLFLSVLIHEFAHAAMFAIFGYGPSDIVLGGIGGVTINRSRNVKSWHDVVISLAGPLASFGLFFLVIFFYWRVPFFHEDRMMVAFLPLLAYANLLWGKFNLLPIPPLDGGHAVRSFLRMFLREVTAFRIAVWIAIVAGVITVVWAVSIGAIFLAALIGWYVFMNYQQWQYYRDHGTPGD